ncbi:hypothetical protein RC62_1004 [Flavobacterium aquidurense]|uniref:Uncharacterized protein n=1 Tax=Flavobacterium aquidurense TaxID=362413 RepID=A0A0Q0RRY8_9FLAO|nr:hypothetical protein RC62_1004 [Flavobacterium aquidurense]
MVRYRVFTESKKFVVTNNVILYSSLIVGFLLFILQKYVFSYFLIPEKILGFILLSIWLIGIFFVIFFSWHTYEPLKGKLDSFLELHENYIVVKKDIFF